MNQPCGIFNTRYEQDIAIVRTKVQWGLLVGLLVILAAMPFLIKGYFLSIVSTIGITIIALHGLNLLSGYCGQISMGHAAFMAVGAYTSGILASRFGLSFWLCLPVSGLSAAVVGSVFGLPALRVKGFYLALATLAAHFIILYIIIHPLGAITGGGTLALQVPPAELFGITFNTEQSAYYLVMFFVVLMTFFAKNLARTHTGRTFISIRDNDIAADVMGISLFKYKVLAFFIGCFYAGIAGSLLAHYTMAIHSDDFMLTKGFMYLGMLIIGGLGSTLGAIFGAIFVVLLDEFIVAVAPTIGMALPAIAGQISASLGQIVFGLAIILFLVFEPRGLAHRWQLIKAAYRLWPFSY